MIGVCEVSRCYLDLYVSGAGVAVARRAIVLIANQSLVFFSFSHEHKQRVDAHEAVEVKD